MLLPFTSLLLSVSFLSNVLVTPVCPHLSKLCKISLVGISEQCEHPIHVSRQPCFFCCFFFMGVVFLLFRWIIIETTPSCLPSLTLFGDIQEINREHQDLIQVIQHHNTSRSAMFMLDYLEVVDQITQVLDNHFSQFTFWFCSIFSLDKNVFSGEPRIKI